MTTTTVVIEYPQSQQTDPQEIGAQWTAVERCPACGSRGGVASAPIPDRHYVFGSERIPLPRAGIPVIACGACRLAYKPAVPSPAFLAGLFERQAAVAWPGVHDFSAEVALLQRFARVDALDLLDVGAASGAMLKACAARVDSGRRSALDVVRFPGIDACISGEFIEGFLDDENLTWSGEPYEVVTMFDVLEHLYRPQVAFANLRSLLKQGGLAYIETGNAESFWPNCFGINQWWYVRLIEHHVFWSRHSLESIADANGFELVYWEKVRHKSRRRICRASLAPELLKIGLYGVARNRYAALARVFGRHGNQPWCPFTRDHFRTCLRKV